MPTPTDDRRDLLTVIAHMKAKPGKEEELRAALEALVEPHHPGERLRQHTDPVEMIVARSTQEAIVVPVDAHPHAPEHAR